jgi:hypothetical protein
LYVYDSLKVVLPTILTRTDLDNAIRGIGGEVAPVLKTHIIKRARALGLTSVLPGNWGGSGSATTTETPSTFTAMLVLEGEVPQPLIQQAPAPENGNVMRMRVPFYMGNSVARAPGIKKPIHFPTELLPSIIQEGKRQIAEGKQPITIYARHAHAADGGYLPIGAVVDFEQEGRIGYAIEEISPTSMGRDVQVLAENKHLNAVSLRSGAGRFQFKDVLVNETPMYQPIRLLLDGIDFAPDGPAQATYGLQILQEDVSVTDETPKIQRRPSTVSDLTLEALKAENPSLIAEIEAPLRRELEAVKAEKSALVAEKNATAREAKLREIAARFPEPDKALPILMELCKDCETDDAVAAKAFPVLLEALGTKKETEEKPEAKLLSLFKITGKGQAITQEKEKKDDEIDPADLTGVMLAEA